MNKIASSILIGTLALGGLSMVNASPDNHGEGHGYKSHHCKHGQKGGHSRFEKMKSVLGLTDAQVKQVEALKSKFQPRKEALRGKMKSTRMQLRATMKSNTVDKTKLSQLATTMGNLKTEKIMLRAEMRSEMDKILTDDQRAKRAAMFKSRQGKHGGGRCKH